MSLQGCGAECGHDVDASLALESWKLPAFALRVVGVGLSQVDLKDKWRNMCKADPSLEDVGKRNGNQAGPHGTPAALRLPPDEQVDENVPPGDEGAQSPRVSVALLGLCKLLLLALLASAAAPGGAQLQCPTTSMMQAPRSAFVCAQSCCCPDRRGCWQCGLA